jgi:hypothetical protein
VSKTAECLLGKDNANLNDLHYFKGEVGGVKCFGKKSNYNISLEKFPNKQNEIFSLSQPISTPVETRA